jgi:hypothetical protein
MSDLSRWPPGACTLALDLGASWVKDVVGAINLAATESYGDGLAHEGHPCLDQGDMGCIYSRRIVPIQRGTLLQ